MTSGRSAYRVLGAAAAFIVIIVLAMTSAEMVLLVRTPIESADAIVVLGGDAPNRGAKAAELYRAGAAPRVLVSGDGDCEDMRRVLIDGGVAKHAITVECTSRNTWENARFSAPILSAAKAQSAILVTSWFHTRRALASFRHFSPQLRWMSAPVGPDSTISLVASIEDTMAIQEYLKIGWYAIRYGLVTDLTTAGSRGG